MRPIGCSNITPLVLATMAFRVCTPRLDECLPKAADAKKMKSRSPRTYPSPEGEGFTDPLSGTLKWHLWNGNVDQALRLVDGLKTMLDGQDIIPKRQKLLGTIREFGTNIASN